MCDILKCIDAPVKRNDIEACHRLKNRNVIVKFSRRKDCSLALYNKKKLKDMDLRKIGLPKNNIYVNESLCGYYKGLWNMCKMIKSQGLIHSFWVSNGSVRYNFVAKGDFKFVTHEEDLYKAFPQVNFNDLRKPYGPISQD